MTDLDISLSGSLQAELAQPGIWAYAVYFDSSGANWTTLASNGTLSTDIVNTGTVDVTLPDPFISGKVYVLVQSQSEAAGGTITNTITSESQISWNTASAMDFRYDSFEVTLAGSNSDVGNLTSVNGFGIPMEISVPYNNSTTGTVGYDISGGALASDIASIQTYNTIDSTANLTNTYTAGPLAGDFRMAVGPATAAGGGIDYANSSTIAPYSAADWAGYVTSLEGPQAGNIILSGQFNGAPDATNVWHDGGYYAYQLQWDSSDGDFWLVPMANSQIKGDIQITPADLENSIYSTLGNVNVYTDMTDTTPYLADMNTGSNNQWGAVIRSLLVGFSAGYLGGSATPINPQVGGTIDLNNNVNWDPTYAFLQNSTGTIAPSYLSYDPYAKLFFQDTNSYGFGYSDALTSQYVAGGPLISVSEPDGSGNVPAIDMTLFADGETPAGYTAPVIYNYIAPPSGDAYSIPTSITTGANITLSFASAVQYSAGVVLDPTQSITLKFLVSDSGGTPVWQSVTLDGATAGANGLWQNWTINQEVGTGSYYATSSGSTTTGSMVISGFPVLASGTGVSWYQIVVGTGADAKTYNLYATTSDGSFENPNYTGQQGALAVDGLATIAAPPATVGATVSTFTVNFATGDTVSYDPSLAVVNTGNVSAFPSGYPYAPVAGTVAGGTFTALPGQDMEVSNTISTSDQSIAFGWTGENDASGTSTWIATYTNKINPGDTALVTLISSTGSTITASGTADLDGQWQTGSVFLTQGTYTVTMQEFLPGDTTPADALTPQSQPLVLTELVSCFVPGTLIRTGDGDVPVEQLTVGTEVPTAAGNGRARVVWLGHRTIDCARHPHPAEVMPVRIRRDAFGPGLPARDLTLSPDHAVFAEDILIPVRYLVNGTTIRQLRATVVTYYHVELDRHDVILAEGLPVESFLDTGNRTAFANAGPVVQLHPRFHLLAWDGNACAPLTVTGPVVERVRARLREEAGLSDQDEARAA